MACFRMDLANPLALRLLFRLLLPSSPDELDEEYESELDDSSEEDEEGGDLRRFFFGISTFSAGWRISSSSSGDWEPERELAGDGC